MKEHVTNAHAQCILYTCYLSINFPNKKGMVENNVLTLTCITYQRLKLTTKPFVIGEPEWLVEQKILENTKTNIAYFISTRPVVDH